MKSKINVLADDARMPSLHMYATVHICLKVTRQFFEAFLICPSVNTQ